MIYKEALTQIPTSDFLLSADRTFADAEDLTRITQHEQQFVAREFRALSGLSQAVRMNKLFLLKRKTGKQMGVGVMRFNLTLREYFDGLDRDGELDSAMAVTRNWLRHLNRRQTAAMMHSYLYQESFERQAFADDSDEAVYETAEEARMLDEYPAFADFADHLTELALDTGVDGDTAYNICSGALLTAIVIRELVEMRQMRGHLSYVVEG